MRNLILGYTLAIVKRIGADKNGYWTIVGNKEGKDV